MQKFTLLKCAMMAFLAWMAQAFERLQIKYGQIAVMCRDISSTKNIEGGRKKPASHITTLHNRVTKNREWKEESWIHSLFLHVGLTSFILCYQKFSYNGAGFFF